MTLATGDRLGPYELVAPLGAGGMGEMWRARDPRLGREVAVKLLPAEVAGNPERLRWFEGEARATAALAHPNVVAIFDVGVDEGRPYLVEELLEGETLGRRIRAGDLTVGRSVALAVQVAQGLAAAHDRGIVHRDLKPDNLFLTRDGVVKILDFGLAIPAAAAEGPAGEATEPSPEGIAVRAVGTPAYMAPEQARGRAVDHRADLFALGAVLYEMLAGARPFVGDSRADLVASILGRDPPPLPPGVPRGVQAVVLRCLEKRPEDRFTSARDVAYALEAALESTPARVMEQRREEPRPYPGLAAFTEADAERFFGREEEVAALWRKVPERTLLALIGPSGAGKTSFVRAGLVAHAPPRWRCLVATPGQSPFAGLARALAPHFAGEPEAIAKLIDLHRPEVGPALVARWAEGCDGALVVIDQAEELFTQSGEEVQARFAELLGRLAELDRVHVLLSLRDDFLMRCGAFAPLRGVFEGLTPLLPPAGDALRRAVVEPARRLGFAFEDEALVEEMLAAVEGERGALPLLAFAVSRLWEERDRERKLLTREAFNRIGGVAGALAQHAEATLERLGEGSVPLVRELFRNLATAQQTRCVLEWEELLSVFPTEQRGDAERVLSALVDARLLTSFELEGADGAWQHRVEVVHESLLRSWPRLQRWQAQDEEGALLRDQLRQAARLWHERGRPEDLLWTGNAVTEYRLWRERYPGGLSAVEETFGQAMLELAGRRRRRRRLAITAAMVSSVVVAMGLAFMWQRSTQEARRAEARKLVALGQLELERNPTLALALSRASLELSDSAEGRRLAVRALWSGPPTLCAPNVRDSARLAFSPDGSRLAAAGYNGVVTILRDDGGPPVEIGGLPSMQAMRGVAFTPSGDTVLSWLQFDPSIRIWSVSGEARDALPGDAQELIVVDEDRVATFGFLAPGETIRAVRVWRLGDQAARLVARWQPPPEFFGSSGQKIWGVKPEALHPDLSTLAYGWKSEVHLVRLGDPHAGRDVLLGDHPAPVQKLAFSPDGSRLVSVDESGSVRLWSLLGGEGPRTLDASAVSRDELLTFDASGSRVGWPSGAAATIWDLADPPDAGPRVLSVGAAVGALAFDPEGRWAAAGPGGYVLFWSLASPYPRVLRGHTSEVRNLTFTRDSAFLASCAPDGARLWPVSPARGRQRPIDLGDDYYCWGLAASPTASELLVAASGVGGVLVPTDGSVPRRIEGIGPKSLRGCALDEGAGVAVVGRAFATEAQEMVIHVADLRSGAVRRLPTSDSERRSPFDGYVDSLAFAEDGSLVSAGDGGVYRWNLAVGDRTRLCGEDGDEARVAANRAGSSIMALVRGKGSARVLLVDPHSGTQRRLETHGDAVNAVAMDVMGERVATGDDAGAVRVGWAHGDEPHLLLHHTGPVQALAFSPDGRWLASASGAEIVLWPVPDLTNPPLHTLPQAELLATLRSLTNLRAVPDPASDRGWKVEVGPFPGWAEVPEWQP